MTAFATCPDCGEPMRWATSDGRRKIRLEPLEVRYIVDAYNVARQVTTYEVHICDEEKRVAHNEAMADRQQRQEIFDKLIERLWEEALKQVCPKCGVDIGVRCANLTERKKDKYVATKWPHEGRVPGPIRVEIYTTLNLTPPENQ